MSDRAPGMTALAERLARLRASYPSVQPQMVGEVVRAVIGTMGADLTGHDAELLRQVEDLGRTIAVARAEIAALRIDRSGGGNVGAASEELDAVVSHTAEATNAILEACEQLDATATAAGGPDVALIQDATMRIYEACSFQDITGQRITKVVATLKTVEAKVGRIVEQFGAHRWEDASPAAAPAMDADAGRRPDAGLLNGPQLPSAAMAQADIDALLAEFD